MSVSYRDEARHVLELDAPWNGQLRMETYPHDFQPTPLQARDLAYRLNVWASQREQGTQAPIYAYEKGLEAGAAGLR